VTVLAAHDLRKSFGRRRVLSGANLHVDAGNLVAVVGENGAGKTTLLRILAGDLRPDSGSVTLCGRRGYCPQSVMLDDALTPDQHLRYFQAAYQIGSLRRAEELLNRLGYAQYRRQPAGSLSGGTRQKLNLTLALMHEPAVLLLDEPYQGFDWETYLAFWDLTAELRAAGTAIVVITHLVFEKMRFDKIYRLHGGRIDEGGTGRAPAT
jgi:ABC-2 type transport system ATP-binding protein